MALPWFLNPWAEVRQLRKYAELWMGDAGAMMAAWVGETEKVQRLENENTVLRQRVIELENLPSGSENLCSCHRCTCMRAGIAGPSQPGWRYACEKCGNKRCPHHEWHQFKCTGSNEPDQIGEVEK